MALYKTSAKNLYYILGYNNQTGGYDRCYSINTKAKIGSNNGEKLSNNQKIYIDHKKKKLTLIIINLVGPPGLEPGTNTL